MVARALAVVHTCMYDAWAAYDNKALPTQLPERYRQPANQRRQINVEAALSYAAYQCGLNLFPGSKPQFDALMAQLGYAISDTAVDSATPRGIGQLAAAAVLASCHNDGSNQANGYVDTTNFKPANQACTVPVIPATVDDVDSWQPLTYNNGTTVVTPAYLAPFWGSVKPFALTSGDQFRSFVARFGPVRHANDPAAFQAQAQALIDLSANLTQKQKMIAEYWADGPHSETPPGHWNLFAQYVSARDRNTLDDDVKLFFALNNAVFDAGIVAWDAKRAFNSVRPVTAIPWVFKGQSIRSWGGPGRGTVEMMGESWIPYQASTFPTPPFPEFISGHSTFSAAAAEVLRAFTHKDDFGASVTFAPGVSKYDPGYPLNPVTLTWHTFTEASDQAGISRRYGGIHFEAGDLAGRAAGRLVGAQVWQKAKRLWDGGKAEDD